MATLLPAVGEADTGKDWDDYRRQHDMGGLRPELTGRPHPSPTRRSAREIATARGYGQTRETALYLSR